MKKMFLSLLILILVPFISSLLLFRQTLDIVTEKTNDYTRATLEQIKTILDSERNNFSSIVYDLSEMPEIISFVYEDLPMSDSSYYSLWDIRNTLQRYAVPEDFIEDLGIYFLRSDTVITTVESRRLDDYYEMYFSETIPTFDEFNLRLNSADKRGIFFDPVCILGLDGDKKDVLPYICRFSTNNVGASDGYVFFFIDLDTLGKILSQADIFSYGNIYLTIGNEAIWSMESNPEIASAIAVEEELYHFEKKGDTIVAYLTSEDWGWTYYLEISSKALLNQWDSIRSILYPLLLVLFLELVGGAVISYMTSKPILKITRSLSKTMEFPPESSKHIDEMKFLESSVHRLMVDNSMLKNTINTHYPILKMEFIKNLCHGEYTEAQEIQEAMQDMGIQIEGKLFLVLLVVLADQEEVLEEEKQISGQSRGRILLMETVEELGKELGVQASFYERNKMVLLLPSNQEEKENFRRQAHEFAASVKRIMLQKYGIYISLFGGNVCHGLEYVSASFSEARIAFEFFWDSEEKRDIYWVDSIPEKSYVHSYTLEVQERLIHLVSAGREEEVLQILEELYQAHFVHTKYPLSERAQLLMEIRGTLLKLYERFKIDYSLFHIYVEDCNQGNEKTFRYMIGYFSSLCKMSRFMKNDKAAKLKEAVLTFVRENYKNPDLSLSMLCERFSMGEAMLSQIFKSTAGDTLSHFVENLRISEACILLSETRTAVSDIALAVGYTNDKSFRRAFKRLKGISPTEFRKNIFHEKKENGT